MKFILEYNKYGSYEIGDLILIHYWYDYRITVVKIIDKVGRKYIISHNNDHSDIFNAPDEKINKNEIIDIYRKK